MLIRLAFLTLLLLLPDYTHAWPARVQQVTDGDTVVVLAAGDKESPMPLRLYGIDAPETDQSGGAAAQAQLAALLPAKAKVEVLPMTTDKYGRVVALIARKGVVVNGVMVATGNAWVEPRYCRARLCKKWRKAQSAAAKEKKGLWAEERPTAPWEWRKAQKPSK